MEILFASCFPTHRKNSYDRIASSNPNKDTIEEEIVGKEKESIELKIIQREDDVISNAPIVTIFILECTFCKKIYQMRGVHRPTMPKCWKCRDKIKNVTEQSIIKAPLINTFILTCSKCNVKYQMTGCRPPTKPLCWKCGDIRGDYKTKKVSSNEDNTDIIKKDNTCVVCLENDITMVITTCGHLCCCNECGNHLDKCPVCRKPFNPKKDLVKVYFVK